VILTGATSATDEGWQIVLPSRSIAVGSPLIVEATRKLTGVSIQAARVHEHEDTWALSAGLEVDAGQAIIGRYQAVCDQPPGLYWLTALNINTGPQRAPTRVSVQPPLLFEVRPASNPPRSLDQLEAAYGEVVRRRRSGARPGSAQGRSRPRSWSLSRTC
jgi:hypothetical protein